MLSKKFHDLKKQNLKMTPLMKSMTMMMTLYFSHPKTETNLIQTLMTRSTMKRNITLQKTVKNQRPIPMKKSTMIMTIRITTMEDTTFARQPNWICRLRVWLWNFARAHPSSITSELTTFVAVTTRKRTSTVTREIATALSKKRQKYSHNCSICTPDTVLQSATLPLYLQLFSQSRLLL